MKLPPTPHYHVASLGSGQVWTSGSEFFVRQIGRELRRMGGRVDYFSCPHPQMACPAEIVYRWETGRAPARVRSRFGRRFDRPKKSLAMKSPAYKSALAAET